MIEESAYIPGHSGYRRGRTTEKGKNMKKCPVSWYFISEREISPFIKGPEKHEQEEEKQEQVMPVQTSIYSNYITAGLKFPNYKKYHLHAFVDSGSGYSLAKKYEISHPEQ